MSANDVVFQVGKLYRDRFIRLCAFILIFLLISFNLSISPAVRRTTTTYSTPSLHPSRPSFDTLEQATTACIEADTTDYRTAKGKVRTNISTCSSLSTQIRFFAETVISAY